MFLWSYIVSLSEPINDHYWHDHWRVYPHVNLNHGQNIFSHLGLVPSERASSSAARKRPGHFLCDLCCYHPGRKNRWNTWKKWWTSSMDALKHLLHSLVNQHKSTMNQLWIKLVAVLRWPKCLDFGHVTCRSCHTSGLEQQNSNATASGLVEAITKWIRSQKISKILIENPKKIWCLMIFERKKNTKTGETTAMTSRPKLGHHGDSW